MEEILNAVVGLVQMRGEENKEEKIKKRKIKKENENLASLGDPIKKFGT